MIDVSLLDGDDRLASYFGLAPSGTPVDFSRSSKAGNGQPRNLVISSCNSFVSTKGRFGRYYDECRDKGVRHNRAQGRRTRVSV